jgi:hypothetical protein
MTRRVHLGTLLPSLYVVRWRRGDLCTLREQKNIPVWGIERAQQDGELSKTRFIRNIVFFMEYCICQCQEFFCQRKNEPSPLLYFFMKVVVCLTASVV